MGKTDKHSFIKIEKTGLINENTISRHEYDIDVFEILDNLHERYSKVPENAKAGKDELYNILKIMKKGFIDFMAKEGINITQNTKLSSYILPSSLNIYPQYLAFKILTIDPYKIEPLLSYQRVLFLGNYYAPKDDFLGLVEFMVYDFVKNRNYFNEDIRLEKIINWIEQNRAFILNNQFYEFRTVAIAGEFVYILYRALQIYFPNSQHSELYQLLFKDKKPSAPLVFNGKLIELADLFKRLNLHNFIVVDSAKVLAEWIAGNFCLKTRNISGIPEQIKPATTLSYLNRDARIPKGKSKMILEAIAPPR